MSMPEIEDNDENLQLVVQECKKQWADLIYKSAIDSGATEEEALAEAKEAQVTL